MNFKEWLQLSEGNFNIDAAEVRRLFRSLKHPTKPLPPPPPWGGLDAPTSTVPTRRLDAPPKRKTPPPPPPPPRNVANKAIGKDVITGPKKARKRLRWGSNLKPFGKSTFPGNI
jgi:hypothetical protein